MDLSFKHLHTRISCTHSAPHGPTEGRCFNADKESKVNQSLDVYFKFLMVTNRAQWAWAADSKDVLRSITLDNAVVAEGK